MIINHNLGSMNAQRQMGINSSNASKSMEKLSSGLRINRAGDDAAGLAISEKMRGQIRGLDQAASNAQDGISLIQTAEGALNETTSILQRMRELATQSANDTNVGNDRTQIQAEINQLSSEMNRIGNTTQYNTRNLLSGDLNSTAAVTAKVEGGVVSGNVSIIDTATKASVTGTALTTASISAVGGGTVTGNVVYATPATVGPTIELTKATATGSVLTNVAATISEIGGATVTGNVAYADHAVNNSGPNVHLTSAVVTGAAIVNAAATISNFDGQVTKGTTVYADPAGAGPDVTALDNELQFTFNGNTFTATLAVKNYDDSGAGTTAADFVADLQTAMRLAAAGEANEADITVSLDAAGKVDIKLSSATPGSTLTVDGGGLGATHLGALTTSVATPNNALTLTVGGATHSIALANATYDLTTPGALGGAGDQADFLADMNGKLDAQFGAGAVVASFDGADKLILTSAASGTASTITNITGGAAATLGLDGLNADYVQGTENNQLTVTLNGEQQTISLATADYSAGGNDSANTFAADVQAKLTALGTINGEDFTAISVGFDSSNHMVFTTADSNDVFTVDSGGAAALVGSSFTTGTEGLDNNELSVTIGGSTQTIALANGTYNFTNAGSKTTLLNDINAKLATAFGTGNATASINGANKLVITDNVTGSASTIAGISGGAASILGLSAPVYAQGTQNDQLTVTLNGSTKTVTLDAIDYSGGNGGADAFAADIEAKLQAEGGDFASLTVGLDSNHKIVFTTALDTDTLSVDGGGAAELVGSSFATGTEGAGNNDLTVTIGGVSKTVTLANDDYDFSVAQDKTDFLADLNAKLNTAFGAGNAVGSFDANNKLVVTNNLAGDGSTIGTITGSASSTLGLASATLAQGQNANNAGTITIDGHVANITLTAQTYTQGGLASDLQTQVRAAHADLANATVSNVDGKFVISSGAEGADGSVTVGADDLANALKLTSTEGAVATVGVDKTEQGLRLQVGANSDQSITVEVRDMRGKALKVTGIVSDGTVTSSNGKVASYVTSQNVTDGTSNTNIEYALDVSTHENATAAISVIDDAINNVSSERAKLGAVQNRLEHTIANLGTSSENMTSAESRIRDVDMAKEMSQFSKNNILSQAAQSMLAQANQQPQQVLQLLR